MSTKKVIAAGIIPIHIESGRVMMIRRGFDQPEPNTWSFFGGKFEKEDMHPKNTAKREFMEESGVGKIKYFISSKPIYICDSNHLRFYNYLGVFKDMFIPNLEIENEAQDYCWFDIDNLPHNMHPGAVELFENKLEEIKSIMINVK